MTTFLKGDSVRLTPRFATALIKMPKVRTDWHARRGVVKCLGKTSVSVIWEGCRTFEILPLKAVELAE